MNLKQVPFWTSETIVTSVSIGVSVTLAIAILLANQWYSNRRERKKLTCEKIEAFYEATISYENACDQLLTDIQLMKYKRESGYYENDPFVYAQFENALTKMTMLHELYFPSADFDPKAYGIEKMSIIWAANSGEIARKTVNAEEEFSKSRQYVESSSKHLRSLCLKLMREHMV
ncbi:hypothetical protein DFP75_10191 [Marinomonas alcarazii]|uniref:Uncharacterized protein n=1 Tax=Marinomonas alcarazii TaxID=491949 RepID=A0A318VJW5_9GAMM|nr:hypothetical protein [Marinomonas alcarazii]PYF84069.1 hypothetical protein DFP75_10191 [Marinomonas alcarazii]